MSNTVQTQAIILSLKSLFERAEKDGLWFYHDSSGYREVWASPEYLRLRQSRGDLLWSAEHWELRNPVGYMKLLHRQAGELVEEYNEMAQRLQLPHVSLMEEQNMKPKSEKIVA